MPTPLKTPITITFTHVENAVAAAMVTQAKYTSCGHPNFDAVSCPRVQPEFGPQMRAALESQGIDWNTWLPEAPFKVAGHEAVFNPDGSVKVGCQVIASKDVDEILKRREKAMAPVNSAAPSEWPKYYDNGAGVVWVARSESDLGMFISASDGARSESLSRPTAMRWCADCKYKRLTRAEAAKILGIPEADL